MSQGIFIGLSRPKSKKAIREAIEAGVAVYAEATSFFGGEYQGPVDCAPVGTKIVFAGPDPHTKRNFYGTITVTSNGIKVT